MILEKARRFPRLRIFAAGGMMYFIFFGAGHIMRVCAYGARVEGGEGNHG